MMSLTLALMGLTSTTGCITGTNPLEGVWVFFVDADYTVTSDSDCSENYNDANCPGGSTGGDSPWTYEYTQEQDTDTFVAQIVGIGGGEAIMFVNDLILTGEKGDAGNWIFTYENFQNIDDNASHEDGYDYNEKEDTRSVLRFRLDRSGGSFEGSMELLSEQSFTWTETDVWSSDDVGVFSSQIPANSYLTSDEFFGNNPDDADCSGGTCELTISGTSQVIIPVTAERTDVNNEGDLDALEDDGDFGWNISTGGGGTIDTGW